MSVTRAIIPAAGRGTRVASMRGRGPKELIDVGGLPMIALALVEVALSGITDVAVIVSRDKPELSDFLEHLPPFPEAPRLTRLYDLMRVAGDGRHRWPRIALFDQPEPLGVVDALSRAEAWLEREPFALVMPDNLLPGHAPPLADVRAVHAAFGDPVMGLVEVTREEAPRMGNCGRVDIEPLAPEEPHAGGRRLAGEAGARGEELRAMRITRIHDKRKGAFEFPEGQDVVWRGVGRSIVPAAFATVRTEDRVTEGELDDVPRFQALASGGTLKGVRLRSRLLDLGQPAGVSEARRWFPGA